MVSFTHHMLYCSTCMVWYCESSLDVKKFVEQVAKLVVKHSSIVRDDNPRRPIRIHI